jgi:hypothetical protein
MEKKRLVVPVEVYSRVAGYFRPVNQWNRGKQEEFSERRTYLVDSCSCMEPVAYDEYKRAV